MRRAVGQRPGRPAPDTEYYGWGGIQHWGFLEEDEARHPPGYGAFQWRSEYPVGHSLSPAPVPREISDALLAEELDALLEAHPEIDATDIRVEICDGAVRLTGVIHDIHALMKVEAILASTPGIRSVREELVIRTRH